MQPLLVHKAFGQVQTFLEQKVTLKFLLNGTGKELPSLGKVSQEREPTVPGAQETFLSVLIDGERISIKCSALIVPQIPLNAKGKRELGAKVGREERVVICS